MRLLFLHPNFPGQLLRPAALMGAKGHDVRFLCQTHYNRSLPGVQRLTLKGALGHQALEERCLKGSGHTYALAEQYLLGMEQLARDGWQPDVVVSHSGWGCGLHSPLVWPNAIRIAYVEWWFAIGSALNAYDPTNQWWPGPGNDRDQRERNLPLALELSEAHALVAPTAWQRQQLPGPLADRCQVIADGVDLKRFSPKPDQRHPTPLITYGTRGMEAMRGFPEFVGELPAVLEAYPQLEVEIAGEDRICYGGPAPEDGSYGRWCQRRLAHWIEEGRVRLVGRLEPKNYVRWLQRSWVHVYLTRPYVASWSLLEAMASGACMVASDTEPVREFLDEKDALLIDHRKPGWLKPVVDRLASDPSLRESLSASARVRCELYDEHDSLATWENLLMSQFKDITA